MDELKSIFANLLKDLRDQKSISRYELAKKANVSERYLIRLEKGMNQPTLKMLYKICSALNVDPKEVIEKLNDQLKPGSRHV